MDLGEEPDHRVWVRDADASKPASCLPPDQVRFLLAIGPLHLQDVQRKKSQVDVVWRDTFWESQLKLVESCVDAWILNLLLWDHLLKSFLTLQGPVSIDMLAIDDVVKHTHRMILVLFQLHFIAPVHCGCLNHALLPFGDSTQLLLGWLITTSILDIEADEVFSELSGDLRLLVLVKTNHNCLEHTFVLFRSFKFIQKL